MAGAGCLFALLDPPSEFYKLLRFAVVAACIAMTLDVRCWAVPEAVRNTLFVCFGTIAAIYNPVFPLDLDKATWTGLNIATAVFMLWLSVPFRKMIAAMSAGFVWLTRNPEAIRAWAIMALSAGLLVFTFWHGCSRSAPRKSDRLSEYAGEMIKRAEKANAHGASWPKPDVLSTSSQYTPRVTLDADNRPLGGLNPR